MFSVVLGTYWGLFGILFATFVARAMTNLWYDPYAVFVYGFGKSPVIYVKKLVKYLTVLLITAGLCQLSFTLLEGPHIVKTLMKIILCSLVTNGVFAAAFCRSDEFALLRVILGRVWSKIAKRNK